MLTLGGGAGGQRARRHRRRAAAFLAGLVLLLAAACARAAGYYAILGVRRDATTKEIKRAYHRLALELHPDKQKEDAGEDGQDAEAAAEAALKRFLEVVRAYEVLSDPVSRRRYDLLGDDGPDARGGGGDSRRGGTLVKDYTLDPFDLFVRFDGGAFEFHYTPKSPKRMTDTVVPVNVPLERLYTGTTVRVGVTRQRFCAQCHGTGAADPFKDVVDCAVCAGTGRFAALGRGAAGAMQLANVTCDVCEGSGKVATTTCPKCNGEKTVLEEFEHTLAVPAGAPPGHKVKLAGQGNQRTGYRDADLEFRVYPAPHPLFKPDGAHLRYTAHISLIEALLGFRKNITHLDGHAVEVVHDIVTFNGYEHVIAGEGMPDPKSGGKKGDLHIHFEVKFPTRLTETQREILRAVMDEDDIAVLEDIIKLTAAAGDGARARRAEEEARREGRGGAGAADDAKDFAAHTSGCDADGGLACHWDPLFLFGGGGIP